MSFEISNNLVGWPVSGPWSVRGSDAGFARQRARLLNDIFADRPWSAEARALAREPVPELFFEGMLHLGRRLESRDEPLAANIYSALQDEPGVGAQAREHLNALCGDGGDAGLRGEVLLRSLARQSLDPVNLFGMATAVTAFRFTRTAMLAHLGAGARPAFLARLLGARNLANLSAFSAEAALFPIGTRLGATLLGRPLDWRPGQVGRELASSFLLLGALRLSGSAAAFAGRSRPSTFLNPAQGVLRQGVLLGGILLGHRAEEFFGLRNPLNGGGSFIDSLALLLQFNVAGRFLQGTLGPRFARMERELELRSAALESRVSQPNITSLLFPQPLVPISASGVSPGFRMRAPNVMLSKALVPSQETTPPTSETPAVDPRHSGIFPAREADASSFRDFELPREVIASRSGEKSEYVLNITRLGNFLQVGGREMIATHAGHPVFLELTESYETTRNDGFYPLGTPQFYFKISSQGIEGHAQVYLEQNLLTLHRVQTRLMSRGMGTVLIDWWATQAAVNGLDFAVHEITNPRVLTILQRSQIFDPANLSISNCVYCTNGFSAATTAPSWELHYREMDNYFADFMYVRGRPNPALLRSKGL